jgi:SAM-dependent methyltransferase
MIDQKRIWDYYQGEGLAAFDGSVGRLRALLRLAMELRGSQPQRVLNIGTGNGWIERACVRVGWSAISLDPSQIAIDGVKAYGVGGMVGLIENLPVPDSSLDVIFCSEVLEHLSTVQLDAGLLEIRRALRPGGILVGSVPFNETLANGLTICPHCGERFHRWGHQQSFDRDRMRALLQQASLTPAIIRVRAFPFFQQPSMMDRVSQLVVSSAGRFGFQSTFPSLVFVGKRS